MSESTLQVGERGYFRLWGEYYPARVLANDVQQTFGPCDEIIAYTKHVGHEAIARTTGGFDPCTNGAWVTAEAYELIRRDHYERTVEDFGKKWPVTA